MSVIVVPLGYGLLLNNELPDASEKTLEKAVKISFENQALIAWTSANYFWPRCQAQEDEIKVKVAENADLKNPPIIGKEGATNSVTEAEDIRQALFEARIELKDTIVVIVADHPHAKSAEYIWRRVFPESIIAITTVEGEWNNKLNPAFLARSKKRWLFANFLRYCVLRIPFVGMKLAKRMKHPISKKGVPE